jgi:geranylgeranyl transferase type-2 subunit beta
VSTYLEDLTLRLAAAAARLPEDLRLRQANWLRAMQNDDGGFSGREGPSDLYYTGFALRSLALLDALDDSMAERAARYLRGELEGRATIIDFLSLLYSALLLQTSAGVDVFADVHGEWPLRVAERLESLRREDGGYAKSDEGASSSTYHSFLVVLCRQLILQPTPEPEKLVAFIKGRQREDGGFVEIAAMKRSGTNPTSAALGLLRILDALDERTAENAGNYLADRQSSEGGLMANTRIAIADTLSTFTGLLSLADLECADWIDLAAVKRYVLSMEQPSGGFRGAELDPAVDVEYTFYALGGLALVEELMK